MRGCSIRHGYGVLLLDRRGEGESEGDPSTRGWGGARDLHAAVAYLQRRPDVERGRIGGLGLSVGGEMMIEAAASTPGLKAVASEGAGIRSLREALDTAWRPESGSLAPFLAIETAATAVFYNHAPPPNLGDLVAKVAPRPLLLMYSGQRPGRRDRAQPGLPPPRRREPRRCGRSRAPATSAASAPSPPSTSAASSASSTPRCAS